MALKTSLAVWWSGLPEMQVELQRVFGLQHVTELRGDAESQAARLPALLTEAKRIALTVHQGTHGRRRAGPGETFWQYRAYEPGEAAGRIDWRQSARSQQLYVREREWEAAQSVWIWPDRSRSMAFRADRDRPFKSDRAVVIALALVALLIRAGERVALLGSGRRPQHGRFGENRFFEDLLDPRLETMAMPPAQELPRHARIVLISDFLAEPEELAERFRVFAAGAAEVVLLQINDQAEEELPFEGRVLFEGLEQEGEALFGQVSTVRERYRHAFQSHREAIRQEIRRFGWLLGLHRTDRGAQNGLLYLHAALGPKA